MESKVPGLQREKGKLSSGERQETSECTFTERAWIFVGAKVSTSHVNSVPDGDGDSISRPLHSGDLRLQKLLFNRCLVLRFISAWAMTYTCFLHHENLRTDQRT
ncbi:hypothetical protein Mapa_016618 [Marchantia paleacea]|nr:hypothetical protein Mapa_016618 [Marchantia paleacea]